MTINLPRLNWPTDVTYQGVTKFPKNRINGTSINFNQPGIALTDEGTCFACNNTTELPQKVAEFILPQPKIVSDLKQANTATVKQGYAEPSEGQYVLANVSGTHLCIGGLLAYQGRLFVSYYGVYDAENTQVLSHLSRPLDLSDKGHVAGPYKLISDKPIYRADGTTRTLNSTRFVNAYSFSLPQEVSDTIGYPAMVGAPKGNIAGGTSNGPCFFGWNPNMLMIGAPTTPFTYYPVGKPLAPWGQTGNLWNGTAQVSGAAYVDETSTILVSLSIGVGNWTYGPGGEFPPPIPNPQHPWAYDPVYKATGPHAFPYENHLVAFDINDIINTINPWDARPYAVWKLDLPFTRQVILKDGSTVDKPSVGNTGGLAYDKINKRVLVMQGLSDGDAPLMHYFGVNL